MDFDSLFKAFSGNLRTAFHTAAQADTGIARTAFATLAQRVDKALDHAEALGGKPAIDHATNALPAIMKDFEKSLSRYGWTEAVPAAREACEELTLHIFIESMRLLGSGLDQLNTTMQKTLERLENTAGNLDSATIPPPLFGGKVRVPET